LPIWLENAYSSPKNWAFGVFHHKMGGNINETPKRHTSGRKGSSGVLIMSVSSIVPEKSRGNKQCDKKEEKRHFLAFLASL